MSKAIRDGYGDALEEFGSDKKIIVLDADLSKSTKTNKFAKKYPERFFNAGIAEANMMGVAAGIASTEKTVFASSFAIFACCRAYEQIRNSIAISKLNVKIGASHGGITVGEDGASHQAIEDIAAMRAVPNITVVSPCDYEEARAATEAAIKTEGPFYIRLSRISTPEINKRGFDFKLGKGQILRYGNDAVIFATGTSVHEALEASKILSQLKIDVSVVDIHTIKPIDKALIVKFAKETQFAASVEEHNVLGGLGSAIAEVLCENHPTKLIRIGVKDSFGRSGTSKELIKTYEIDSETIVKKIALELNRKIIY